MDPKGNRVPGYRRYPATPQPPQYPSQPPLPPGMAAAFPMVRPPPIPGVMRQPPVTEPPGIRGHHDPSAVGAVPVHPFMQPQARTLGVRPPQMVTSSPQLLEAQLADIRKLRKKIIESQESLPFFNFA